MTVSPIVTPAINISSNANNICAGTAVTFTTSQTNGGTSPAYQWLINGSPAGANISSFNSSSLNNGDVVNVILTSNATCVSTPTVSASITMTVSPMVNPSVIISANNNNICAGTTVTFTTSQTNGGTNPTYQWLVNGNPVGTNNSSYNSSSLNNGDVINVILTTNANCAATPTASAGVTMIVSPIVTPSISVSVSTNTICAGTMVTFTTNKTNAGISPVYQWFVNSTAVGSNSSTYYSSSLNNGDVVTVVMTSNANCLSTPTANSNTISINVLPVPTASFTYTNSDQDIQFYNQSTNATIWAWDLGFLSSSILQNPSYTFPGGAEYVVTLTASNGVCKAVTSQTITVEGATYYIPNTFTPNGDGVNDFYYLVGTGISAENFEMNIFNRWGEVIFKTNDLNKSWDGRTHGGEDVAEGVYTYLFEFQLKNTDNIIKKTGSVTVFR